MHITSSSRNKYCMCQELTNARSHLIIWSQVPPTFQSYQPRCFPLTPATQTNTQGAIWTSCMAPFTLPGVLLTLFSEQTVQLNCRQVNKSQRRASWGKGQFTRQQIELAWSHWLVPVTKMEKATLPPLVNLLWSVTCYRDRPMELNIIIKK